MNSEKSNDSDPTLKSDEHVSNVAWKYDLSGSNVVAGGTEGSKGHDSSPYSVEKEKAPSNTGVPFGDGDDGDISSTRRKPTKSSPTPRSEKHPIPAVAWKYDLSGSSNAIGRTVPKVRHSFHDPREKGKAYKDTGIPFGDEDDCEISFTSDRHGDDEDIEEDSVDIDLSSSFVATAKEIELRREIYSLKEKAKVQDAKVDELQKELQITTNALQETTNAFDNARNDLRNTQNDLNNAKNDLQTTQNYLQTTQNDLQNTQNDLQNTQNDLQNTQKTLRDTTNGLQNTQNDLQNQMQEMRALIDRGSIFLPNGAQEEWNDHEEPRQGMMSINGVSFVPVNDDSREGGWSNDKGPQPVMMSINGVSLVPFQSYLTDGSNLASDTFTLMMISDVRSRSWALGVVSFMFQMTLGTMIALDQISSSSESSIFDVPVKVSNVVRTGQFFTILLCLATQSDVLTSVQAVVLLGKGSSWDKVIGKEGDKRAILWIVRIALPNLLKFVQGILVMFVSFVIIVRSDDIIDLLKDFMALMVLSETDNIMFGLAGLGYLGRKLKKETLKAKERSVISDPANQSPHRIFFVKTSILLSLCLPMIGFWIMISVNQLNGNYFYDKYPKCGNGTYELALEHFGDGKCYGGVLNKLECGFEGGDCINFNLAFPLCKGDNLTDVERKVGDGVCNEKFQTFECEYDGGDCCPLEIVEDPKFGDGQCNGGIFSTERCGYDNGDCNAFSQSREYGECDLDKLATIDGSDKVLFGDNVCDSGLYTSEECGFESGDCSVGQIGQDLVFHGIAPGTAYYFDLDMSADGTTIAIGLPNSDKNELIDTDLSLGIVKVFAYDAVGKVWSKKGNTLVGDDFGEFGISISLSSNGNRIAIGIPYIEIDGDLQCGQVKIFDFDDSVDDWVLVGQPINGDEGDTMGFKVDMTSDGGMLAIQSHLVPSNAGRIQVYKLDESLNEWVQVGNDILGRKRDYLLGAFMMKLNSVGSRLLLDSDFFDRFENDGFILVYGYNETSSKWVQLGNDISSPNVTSCAINSDGNRIAFSTQNTTQAASGFVTVYDFNATSNNWAQVGDKISTLATEESGDRFGLSIAMSSNGDLIAVTSADITCTGKLDYCTTGSVHLYTYDGTAFFPTPSKADRSRNKVNVIQDRESTRTTSMFGVKLAINDSGSTLSIAGYNVKDENGFVKVIDIDKSFYLKCAVIKPHWISDEYCDDYAPYNTKECNWDGGDCSIPQPVDGYPECIISRPEKLNDTFCQPTYDRIECGWDMGDCVHNETL